MGVDPAARTPWTSEFSPPTFTHQVLSILWWFFDLFEILSHTWCIYFFPSSCFWCSLSFFFNISFHFCQPFLWCFCLVSFLFCQVYASIWQVFQFSIFPYVVLTPFNCYRPFIFGALVVLGLAFFWWMVSGPLSFYVGFGFGENKVPFYLYFGSFFQIWPFILFYMIFYAM